LYTVEFLIIHTARTTNMNWTLQDDIYMDIANNNKSTIRTLVQLLNETYLH